MEKETKCIQAGYTPKNGESRMIPIIQSTTFKYETSDQMGRLFDLEDSGYFYTRLQNPTVDAVAAQLCNLGGAVVDSGHFPWDRYPERFPGLTTPDASYHGLTYTKKFGKAACSTIFCCRSKACSSFPGRLPQVRG